MTPSSADRHPTVVKGVVVDIANRSYLQGLKMGYHIWVKTTLKTKDDNFRRRESFDMFRVKHFLI